MRRKNFSFFILIFISIQLLYNVVLVSTVQQSESLIHTHVVVRSPSRFQFFATPGTQHAKFPVPHHLLEFAQVHVHCISDAVQPSHPLMPSSPSAPLFFFLISLFFGLPSHLGHHRALSRGPCDIQQVLITYLFYTECDMSISISQFIPHITFFF